jgi:hypothetical protein
MQIFTTQFQSWKICALLKGLGFTHKRTNAGDYFFCETAEIIYDDWEPRPGAPAIRWPDLNDTTSLNFRRRYLTAYRVTVNGHDNVLVWVASPHESDQLFSVCALCSYYDFQYAMAQDGLAHVLACDSVAL